MRKLSKKDKWRQLRLQRRLLKRAYRASRRPRRARHLLAPSPALENLFKRIFAIREHRATQKRVVFPDVLDLDLNLEEVLALLDELRGSVIFGKFAEVFLDLSRLTRITVESALLLLAEIDRCRAFSGNVLIQGNYPASSVVCSILKEMGYFKYFEIVEPPIPKAARQNLEVISSIGTDGFIANSLIQLFENQLKFHPLARRYLFNALIECMQNVGHHAYLGRRLKNRLLGRWWLVGYSDSGTGEVSFSFVDQGVGIPTTLRRKWKDALQLLLPFDRSRVNQSELVQEAIGVQKSRLKDIRRGNGLKTFVDLLGMAPAGRFRITSNRANNIYQRENVSSRHFDSHNSFDGTLISWTLYPEKKQAKDVSLNEKN